MQSQLQRVEIQSIVFNDDNLSVEHTSRRQSRAQWLNKVRKVAVEWLFVATLDQNLVAIAKHQRPKPVPLGLKNPFFAIRQRTHTLGKHRQDRRVHGKVHAPMVYAYFILGSWEKILMLPR